MLVIQSNFLEPKQEGGGGGGITSISWLMPLMNMHRVVRWGSQGR